MMNKLYRITLVVLVLFFFFFLGCTKEASTCDAVQGNWELVE